MIKVIVIFKDGTQEEFYSEESYSDSADGRMIFWNTDKGETISYPVGDIKKVIEKDA